ncbi:MAG: homoserine dehydrogenase [Candidatus Nitrosotenuis sp.]|uniref:homoserine dehydrogenase n=1 Tax=Candidatus Nitrosotenuis uzonensis TaxID=1407055 RepID=V6AS06_9ARCH|nr:homoserine dehydrogenase [Candidatus Nitrosotenuis uzonensis]MCA2003994.1 homoserine dehydrogenase [Candidatus Nitrosotenuis sp.]CAE6501148.1 Homoserine dehydrogenase [Candidatus Nitrosotenuis uzonensis]CDI05442.1 Homoserine dehydrogenase [Candidatus Nitrosotenuis uzonensis]
MRIIICGFGTVAQSLAKLLVSRMDDLYAKYGIKPRIVGAFDSKGGVSDPAGLDVNRLIEVKKKFGTIRKYDKSKKNMVGLDIINNVDADVLVETTASNYRDAEPGMSHIISAMKRRMHVISVNKGPLALAFPSLMELATYNQVLFRFSGTVGGGTPILDYAKNSLRGEQITSFAGILNGTTNYILTNMARGMSFEAALKDAKSKGYVEADESLDLDGLDAAAKLVILANWIMGMKVTMPDIKRTGIRGVTTKDIKAAAKKKCAVKLIASCNKELIVAPREVPVDDPLCVNGTLNAISFTSEHSGTQTIIGRGAGGTETASSILRDLLDIRKEISRD